ncbi:MAG: MFS transporter [Phycisphaerae bacterium]|nr:MFS transporter [Phycisphaerae bacterium]
MSNENEIEAAAESAPVSGMWRALGSRNYRLWFGGQFVSLVGLWMAHVAMGWMVYRLTGSKLLLGTVAFAGQIPAFFLGPLAGVLIDRWDLRRALIVTQALAAVQAAVLAAVVITGVVEVWQVIALATALGVVNAFDMPARHAFVVQMVERREDLPNAIALNSSLFNASRLIGPAVGGALVAAVGEGACFALNAASFIAVIAALAAMRVRPVERPIERKHILHELAEGLRYVAVNRKIRSILAMIAVVSVAGIPYAVLMPVFARDILMGGPRTLGLLTTAVGVGALAGGLALASRTSTARLYGWFGAAAGALGAGLVFLSMARELWVALAILPAIGFAATGVVASGNTLLQSETDDARRGRVMACFSMAFQGMMPMGSLLAGAAAETRLGAPGTVMAGGLCCLAAAVVYWAFHARR